MTETATLSPAEALKLFRERTQAQEATLLRLVQDAEAEAVRQADEILSQTELTETEKQRQAAEQRRLEAIAAFEQGALADAQNKFASLHQRIGHLNDLARQAESLHAEIVAGALAVQSEAGATIKALVDALPEPSEETAHDALNSAGAAGLNYRMPSWLQSLNERRWLSAPSVTEFAIYQLAGGLASERQRKR